MTYEDDKLEQALSMLKEMERECAGDIGWLKSVKNKMFRTQETGVSFFFINTMFFINTIYKMYTRTKYNLQLSYENSHLTNINFFSVSNTCSYNLCI